MDTYYLVVTSYDCVLRVSDFPSTRSREGNMTHDDYN